MHINREKVDVKRAGKIGVEVRNAYSILLFFKKQQQTDMVFYLKVMGIITFISRIFQRKFSANRLALVGIAGGWTGERRPILS